MARSYKEEALEKMGEILQNLMCPITLALPVKPVTAEDGFLYDLEAIERHLALKRTDDK